MKEVKLLALSIQNFKGCSHLILDLAGRSASIYGDNAAGKTTIFDALTWLLFNKDSRGHSSFEIKPLGSDGQVKDHAAVTEVEATFISGGTNITLRKDKLSFWTSSQAEMRGDGFSHASGLAYVPYDNYPANLHRGEAVLNATDASSLLSDVRKLAAGGGNAAPARIEVVMNLDGQTLARKTFSYNQRENTLRGESLVEVYG